MGGKRGKIRAIIKRGERNRGKIRDRVRRRDMRRELEKDI